MKKRCRIPEDERKPGERIHKVANALQLPAGVLGGAARYEISGNREVIVDGCRGILEYDDKSIKINSGKMITCFSGRGLTIKCLTEDSLIIEGFITSIEFVT
jgi:sporulation protein YqfC